MSLLCCAAWALLARLSLRPLLARALPVAAGFSFLLLAAPFAPGAAGAWALRGFAVSAAILVAGAQVPWPVPLGMLQALRAPPALLAFLAILARHLGSVEAEVLLRARALLLRGGFAGVRGSARSTGLLLQRTFPALLDRADRVAAALELRGFRGRVPLPDPWRPSLRDLPPLALAALAAAVAFAERSR